MFIKCASNVGDFIQANLNEVFLRKVHWIKKRNKLTSILANIAKRNIYLNVQKIPNDYENGLCIFTVNKKWTNFNSFLCAVLLTVSSFFCSLQYHFLLKILCFILLLSVLITYSFIYSMLYHCYFDLSYNYQFFTLSVPLSVTFHYSFFHN